MPQTASQKLPVFLTPPIHELALGVRFAPLPFPAAYYGLYWAKIRNEFPGCQTQPPIMDPPENFTGNFMVAFNSDPDAIRCWYTDATQNRLVQLQRDRFIVNWRKRSGGDVYPQFDADVRPRFEIEWERFADFLRTENLGSPTQLAGELIYVNHVELPGGREAVKELGDYFTLWSAKPNLKTIATPDRVSFSCRFPLADNRGHLVVSLTPAADLTDREQKFLLFTIAAKGKPSTDTTEGVYDWMTFAHNEIAKSLLELTTEKLRATWRPQREDER